MTWISSTWDDSFLIVDLFLARSELTVMTWILTLFSPLLTQMSMDSYLLTPLRGVKRQSLVLICLLKVLLMAMRWSFLALISSGVGFGRVGRSALGVETGSLMSFAFSILSFDCKYGFLNN